MTLPTYTLLGDTDNDGTYATDLSACVHGPSGVEWSIGMGKPLDSIARESTLDFALINTDGSFSPSHGSAMSGFQPGMRVKLKMTYGGTTATKFTGRILSDGLEPALGAFGENLTRVRCGSFWYILKQQQAICATQQDITTGAAIEEILLNLTNYPPVAVSWVLGIPGMSELGETTYLSGGISDFANIDTTNCYQFNYFGDSLQGEDAFRVLREIAETEDGLLWLDETGMLQFRSSGWLITDQVNAADATLSETDIIEGVDEYGSQLINRVVLTYYPRVVGSAGTQVGYYSEPLKFDPNTGNEKDTAITITINYVDSDGRDIGVLDVITPAANIDWTAHDTLDGDIDTTSYVEMTATDTGSGLLLTIWHSYTNYLQIDTIAVRGTPLTAYGRTTIEVEDEDSITSYGLSEARYNRKYMDDPTYAQDWALWQLHQYKTPGDVLKKLTITGNRSATHWGYVRDLVVGSRIVVSESHIGLASGSYYVVGTRHRIRDRRHDLEMVLRPAPPAAWVLGEVGFSELGETTYLGLGV